MEIRVAIFEDNKLVRDALEAILNGTPGFTCCGVYPDGNNSERNIKSAKPDVVLMDIEMPGLNGIEVTEKMTAQFPDIKILIQTVFNDSEKIFQAMCAGASGYILKNSSKEELLNAIHAVCEGNIFFGGEVGQSLREYQKSSMTQVPLLSPREKEILVLIAEGYTNPQIAEKIFLSSFTIDSHRKNLLAKLNVKNTATLIKFALEHHLI